MGLVIDCNVSFYTGFSKCVLRNALHSKSMDHSFASPDDGKPHKSWFITVMNWNEEEYSEMKSWSDVTYGVLAKEIAPTTGTPHLHFQATFRGAKRRTALKKLLPRANIGFTRNLKCAIDYCQKLPDYVEIGGSEQGRRTDLEEACAMVIEDGGLQKVADELPVMFVKYGRGLERLRMFQNKQIGFKKLEVTVVIGKPDSGKSRTAWDLYPDLYEVAEPQGMYGVLWFDGYDGEKTILFDEFTGKVSYTMMCRLLDGYPMKLQTKGGFCNKKWERVFITSNVPLEDWWCRDEFDAIKRRITSTVCNL